jgi:hypothetical protein
MAGVEGRVSPVISLVREGSPFSAVSLADSLHRSETFEAALLAATLDRVMFAHYRDTLTYLHSVSTMTCELSAQVCEAAALRPAHDPPTHAVDVYLIHVSRLSLPEFLDELTGFAEATVHRLLWLSASAPTVATGIIERWLDHKKSLIALCRSPQYLHTAESL